MPSVPDTDDLRIVVQPDLRRKRLTATVKRHARGVLRLGIEGTPYAVEGSGGEFVLEFPEFTPWSPEKPCLYTLTLHAVPDGPQPCVARVRFGMRDFSIKDSRFHLNGRPCTIKGVCYSPPRECPEQAVRRDFTAIKGAGFDLIVAAPTPAAGVLAGLADELGLLLFQRVPPEAREGPGLESFIREVRNSASVVAWVAPDAASVRTIQAADPGRVVLELREGESSECMEHARPFHPGTMQHSQFWFNMYAPSASSAEVYAKNVGTPEALNVVLAVVPASLQQLPADDAEEFRSRELSGAFGDEGGFCRMTTELQAEALKNQLESLRANAKGPAIVLSRFQDEAGAIGGGLVNIHGLAKPALNAVKTAFSPLLLVIRAVRTNLTLREEVPVSVYLVNDERSEARADLSLQVVGPTNQVLWKKKRTIKLPKQSKEIWTGAISASGSTGIHRFVVRLMQGVKVLSQNSLELHVIERVKRSEVEIQVMDPHREWMSRCLELAKPEHVKAHVYIVPPLANTVRAYPESELGNLLAEVHSGAVALLFSPPADWNDFADRVDPVLRLTSKSAAQAYHYVRMHPVFDGLPTRGLMRQAYRNVVPRAAFVEGSDEEVCGSYAAEGPGGRDSSRWGDTVLVRRYGAGRLVFVQLRVLEHLGADPIADRLFVNLLNHFARRAVPMGEPSPIAYEAIEWLRRERAEQVRLWMVCGPFANWRGSGHDTVYGPESGVDLSAVYPGWYSTVRWLSWYTVSSGDPVVRLIDAVTPLHHATVCGEFGVLYAYAECSAPARQQAHLRIRCRGSVKVWLNGSLVHEARREPDERGRREGKAAVSLKQGKNSVLVKLSCAPGTFDLEFDFEPAGRDALMLKWWK